MKRRLLIIFYACVPLSMMAQDDMISKINAIKMDTTYLYGEATLKTQEEASSSAKHNLQISIMEWVERETNNPCRLIMTPLIKSADSLITKRAKMIRFFSYVKKDNIKSRLLSEGVRMGNVALRPDTIPISTNDSQSKSSALEQIMQAKSFYQLKRIIEPLSAQGQIRSYGKYATMTQPSDSYLIIYDPDGDIRAFLGKGSSRRKNLVTGQDDSEHNYSGCGAIWFQLNQ